MKKVRFILLMFLTISAGVNAQNVNIPDANFKTYLVGRPSINTNGDSEIQVNEASVFNGTINCESESINDLTGIEAFTSLTILVCTSNNLVTLDLSQNDSLKILSCFYNDLTSIIPPSGINNALTQFLCGNNQLSYLDLSNLGSLEILKCQGNNLTGGLDLSNNVNLDLLHCGDCNLSSLDVSNNINLNQLFCKDNNLTSLDLSNLLNLSILYCPDNSLGTLNTSSNIDLAVIYCKNNALTSMNVANGYNTNIGGSFNTLGNPNLTCIQVDDVNYSNTNWTDIDAQASFSTSCSWAEIIETEKTAIKIYPNPVQNQLFIELETDQIAEITILDYSGRIVKSIVNNNAEKIDVSELKQGVYLLKVSTDFGISTKRFVKD